MGDYRRARIAAGTATPVAFSSAFASAGQCRLSRAIAAACRRGSGPGSVQACNTARTAGEVVTFVTLTVEVRVTVTVGAGTGLATLGRGEAAIAEDAGGAPWLATAPATKPPTRPTGSMNRNRRYQGRERVMTCVGGATMLTGSVGAAEFQDMPISSCGDSADRRSLDEDRVNGVGPPGSNLGCASMYITGIQLYDSSHDDRDPNGRGA